MVSLILQTPPTMYRRQVDQVQYNSLPRQSFPTLVQSTTNNNNSSNSTNGSMNADLDVTPPQQQTPQKQRTVAFGKGFSSNSSSYYSTPTIHHAVAMEGDQMERAKGQGVTAYSTNNIYHHQLVLGQPSSSGPLIRGLDKQRGYSVPNLGGYSIFTNSVFPLRLLENVNVLFYCSGH